MIRVARRGTLVLSVLLLAYPVLAGEVDVVVVGAGPAGIGAALSAARLGVRTMLVERSAAVGGTTVLSDVKAIGLFHAWGRQIIDGPAWEVVTNAVALDAGTLPDFTKPMGRDHNSHCVRVNPVVYSAVAEEALRKADVFVKMSDFVRHGGGWGNYVVGADNTTSAARADTNWRGRAAMLRVLRFLRRQPGLEKVRVVSAAAETGVRETCRIEGEATITGEDYLSGRIFGDALCYSYWMLDVHDASRKGGELVYLDEGRVATVPYGAMLPKGVEGVLVAGRAVSSDRRANGALRVQASCMAMGQAAGAAAALSVTSGKSLRKLDPGLVRDRLRALGAIVPSAAGIRWEPLGEPGGGGRIVSLEVSPHDPRHLVAGGDMLGCAVSFDGGDSWTVGRGLPSYEMAAPTFHPLRADEVWMGSCMGPLKSTDEGGARVVRACFAGTAYQMVASPQVGGTAYGFNSETIVRTRDGGKTWDDATAYRPDPVGHPDSWRGRGWTGWCSLDFVFNPFRKGQSLALAMDAGRGWLSDDGLRTWRYTKGDSHPWLGGRSAAFSRDGFIYITTGQFGNGNGIQQSRDGGRTWRTLQGKARGLASAGWSSGVEYWGIYAMPDDGRRVWVVMGGDLVATTDGGERWTKVEGVAKADHLAGDPTRAGRFYLKTAEGVLEVEDGRIARNWGQGGCDPRGRIRCDAEGNVYLCRWRHARTSGVWKLDRRAGEWRRILDQFQAIDVAIDPTDVRRLLVVTSQDPYYDKAAGSGVFVSEDGGRSWSPVNDGLAIRRANCCAFDPFDSETVVIGTYGGGFLKTRWGYGTISGKIK